PLATAPVSARDKTAAVVGGIIAGAAIGAAVSSSIDHPRKVYVPGPPPPDPWGRAFSPKPGIFCYPARRACYNARGIYSANWTYTIYAR
ncbi:MAG: hypothetical protein ACREDO_00440, partial [Methyloceanibacter sp.]